MNCLNQSKWLKKPLARATSLAAATIALNAGYASAQQQPALEEIVVSGVRSSIEDALDRKRNASGFQDSIAAEDIGKFPDQNVAEALQRISGVSISRLNGEGSQVTVRGFGPEFNIVNLNGRTLATALAGRDFDFQVISSDLIVGADIVKTPDASTSEGSIGALVDLRTARPLDNPGTKTVFSLKRRNNDLADDANPEASAIYRGTFDDDSWGIYLGASFQKGANRIDQTGGTRSSLFDATGQTDVVDVNGNPIPGGLVRHPGRQEFSLITEERERMGLIGGLQWQLNEEVALTIDGLYTDFEREGQRVGFQLPILVGDFTNLVVSENDTLLAFDAGLNTPQRLDVLQIGEGSDSQTYSLGFNIQADYGDISYDADLHFSKSEALLDRADYVPQLGTGVGDDLGSFTFNSTPNDVPDVTSTIPVNDPSVVRAHWNQVATDDIEDELVEFKFNALKNVDEGMVDSVKAGVFYSDRSKTVDHSEIPSTVFCLNTCGSGTPLDASIFGVTDVSDFLSDEPGNFPREFVFIRDFDAYFDAISQLNGVPGFENPVPTPRASSVTDEEIYGAYVQLNLSGELGNVPWSGNVGLRYAKTDTVSSGVSQFIESVSLFNNDPNTTALVTTFSPELPVSVENSYSNVLPSLNLTFELRDDLLLRLAASQVITRPSISDLSVAETFQTSNIETFGVISGNPTLTPYEVNQFDIGLEYYGDNTSLAIAFYTKDIETFISEATIIEDSGFVLPFTGPLSQARTAQQNRNGGKVSGIELSGTHHFDYLPGFLKGFGVQANYTFADTEDDNAPDVALPLVTEPSIAVEGFAENAYNLVAFYDKGAFQARFAYNWRDTFLLSRQGLRSFGLPEHVEDFGQLDFSASYDVTDNISLSFEGVNLTDERQFRFEDVEERLSLIQYTGRRFVIGLRATF